MVLIFTKNTQVSDSLTNSLVEEYFNNFFPNAVFTGFELMPEGWENISILIKSTKSYILRISSIPKEVAYKKDVKQIIEREHDYMTYLINSGVNVPKLYPVHGKNVTYSILDSKDDLLILTLMDYIVGEHPAYTSFNIEKVCKVQATLHNISHKYAPTYTGIIQYSAMSHRVKSSLRGWNKDFPSDLYNKMYQIYLAIYPEIMFYFKKTKKQIIHSDIKRDNIIFSDRNDVHLIDFGDIRYSVIAEDLGTFIWDMCNDLYDEKMELKRKVIEYLDYYQDYNTNFSKEDKCMAINYAIDRYLVINLYYLVENQVDRTKLKYQTGKAKKQLKIIERLLQVKEDF